MHMYTCMYTEFRVYLLIRLIVAMLQISNLRFDPSLLSYLGGSGHKPSKLEIVNSNPCSRQLGTFLPTTRFLCQLYTYIHVHVHVQGLYNTHLTGWVILDSSCVHFVSIDSHKYRTDSSNIQCIGQFPIQ